MPSGYLQIRLLNKIKKNKKEIKVWSRADPNDDAICMQPHQS